MCPHQKLTYMTRPVTSRSAELSREITRPGVINFTIFVINGDHYNIDITIVADDKIVNEKTVLFSK